MFIFEFIVALLLVGAVLSLWAAHLGIPYPALLALTGAAIALIPGMPEVSLDPELALALFVAPTLLDAAYDASPRDLRDNLVPVISLALGAVGLTIAAVALLARLFVPDMGWAAAITLGAIVAPPDTSAAVAVLRRIAAPHRVSVVLEGESLFNDASALLVYRIAAAAAMTGSFSGWSVAPVLALTWGGGVLAGILLARLYLRLTASVQDIPISILLQFISTFAVWIFAVRIGVSAIITVVCYAMTISRYAPARMDAARRIASYAVWDVAVFVLNVMAFILIGLQLRGIVTRLDASEWRTYGLCAVAVCAGLIISWCGMRGIVSLATALALPSGSPGVFPYRDLIVLCAFSVVLTTLVIQGLTLRWLIEWTGVRDDGLVEREVGLARAETARVALRALEEEPSPIFQTLRRDYEARRRSGADQSAGSRAERSSSTALLQRLLVDTQRQA